MMLESSITCMYCKTLIAAIRLKQSGIRKIKIKIALPERSRVLCKGMVLDLLYKVQSIFPLFSLYETVYSYSQMSAPVMHGTEYRPALCT
ncbi:hypothetical protein C5H23_07045 [Xylella fastidiosa]|nr:hypothetical protein M233_09445 [Xylella fastidiosa subsp. multiplex Griffin-1]OMJ98789.1 hypothetical protein XYFPCFBP8417_09165 [Xylella fastidiosa subsp. multiplex]RWA38353.1 hypothetical protein XfCFBP8078_01970 [Xylella fastidiosa subsp. multiplex]TNV89132.1 hypothetical protein C5H23_07045 [Xylella fastidiosa]TNV97728.1 hypothetical protein C5H21_12030 [Xylella fastidiosa]